ncbi:MAG: hypothetical protein AABY07_06455 [Nanoarchaeota archaeon]
MNNNKKRGKLKILTLFIILAFIFLPISESIVYAQLVPESQQSTSQKLKNKASTVVQTNIGEQAKSIAQDIRQSITEPPEGIESIIGEDIIINVDQYQPTVIRTGLLEDTGVTVFALLSGIPTNPTITIPRILRIEPRVLKIETVPAGKPVSIGAITHKPPRAEELSYSNLGYLVIPIRRIPREDDVPDNIVIDMQARVHFDVSSGLIFRPKEDVLTEHSYDDWLKERDNHAFYGGYIRASEITDQGARFVVYDEALNEILNTNLIPAGQKSNVISTQRRGLSTFGRVFDKFIIRVNEIRSQGNRARLYLTRDGDTELKVLTKGQSLYPDSSWYVNNIYASDEGAREVELKNRVDQKIVKLTYRETETVFEEPKITMPEDKEKLEELRKKYNGVINEKNNVKNQDYSNIYPKFGELLSDPSLTQQQALDIKVQLEEIYGYYSEYLRVAKGQLDSAKEQEITRHLFEVDTLIKKIESLSGGAGIRSTVRDIRTAKDAFELSSQSYSEYADKYPDLKINNKNLAVESLYKAALINWIRLNDINGAIAALEKLLADYKQEDIDSRIYFSAQDDLRILKRLRTIPKYEGASKTLTDNNQVITVSLTEVEAAKKGVSSSAVISIDGKEELLHEGMISELLRTDYKSLKINRIRDNEISLSYTNEKNVEVPITLTKGENQISVPESAATLRKIKVSLLRTSLLREVYITIEPESERAFSETTFQIRLGIEKRPFGLPLFSETIDEEIAKTERLITKLDKVIANAVKLHEYWKKLCFLVYGTLWIKNLFSPQTAAARTKVNEVYKERFNKGDLDCPGIRSFEQCIFSKYQTEYEDDIKNSIEIIDQINDDAHLSYLKGLPESYNDDKQDLYFLRAWHQEHPENQYVATKYYSSLISLKQREIEEQATRTFFDRNIQKPYSANTAVIDSMISNVPVYKEQLATKKPEQIYNENRDAVFEAYKDKKIADEMNAYYNALMNNLVPEFKQIEGDQTIISKIKDDRRIKFSQTKEIDRRKILFENGKYYFNIGETRVDIGDTLPKEQFEHEGMAFRLVDKPTETPHKPMFSIVESGRAKGKLEFLSIDALHYIQIAYSASGKIEGNYLYRRSTPNGPMGESDSGRIGLIDDPAITKAYISSKQKEDPRLSQRLGDARNCISTVNRNLVGKTYRRGDTKVVNCAGLGSYSVVSSARSIQNSCIDYMSPTDCKVLYNACDPVICPASRCDFGGEWPVENVVETGIIGSALLCIQNFPEVVFPICLTGVIAGLQNIRTVLIGYKDCLTSSKVEGRSVGICDKIRSIGVCEILWREGIGIFNLREGLFTKLVGGIFFPEAKGGGEYGSFKQSFDNSIENMKFFTQDYAKNTFAQYSGGSLPEIGSEVCKAAIFGKVPGIGNFFDQVIRPESPPQFTAFFDEVPFTDIPDRPFSMYSTFYHVYAGENQDITFSIFLSSEDVAGQSGLKPYYIIRPRILPRGQYDSNNIDIQLPSGYKQICIDIRSNVYGQKLECGFGKVSTSFMLNYIEDKFVNSESLKQIDTEEECSPQQGRITTLSPQDFGLEGVPEQFSSTPGYQIPRPLVGSFSTGLLRTGIMRKCSAVSPGLGSKIDDWVPVGTCGKDDRDRDLGICWLYRPGVERLIDNTKDREALNKSLEETARNVVEQINVPGLNILDSAQIEKLLTEAGNMVASKSENSIREAIKMYEQILHSLFVTQEYGARALFDKARAYEELGIVLLNRAGISPPSPGSIGPSLPPPEPSSPGTATAPVPKPEIPFDECIDFALTKDEEGRIIITNSMSINNDKRIHIWAKIKNSECQFDGYWKLTMHPSGPYMGAMTIDIPYEGPPSSAELNLGDYLDLKNKYISFKIQNGRNVKTSKQYLITP